jgi:hypothetical protein
MKMTFDGTAKELAEFTKTVTVGEKKHKHLSKSIRRCFRKMTMPEIKAFDKEFGGIDNASDKSSVKHNPVQHPTVLRAVTDNPEKTIFNILSTGLTATGIGMSKNKHIVRDNEKPAPSAVKPETLCGTDIHRNNITFELSNGNYIIPIWTASLVCTFSGVDGQMVVMMTLSPTASGEVYVDPVIIGPRGWDERIDKMVDTCIMNAWHANISSKMVKEADVEDFRNRLIVLFNNATGDGADMKLRDIMPVYFRIC